MQYDLIWSVYLSLTTVQCNLSVTNASIMKFITYDLFSIYVF